MIKRRARGAMSSAVAIAEGVKHILQEAQMVTDVLPGEGEFGCPPTADLEPYVRSRNPTSRDLETHVMPCENHLQFYGESTSVPVMFITTRVIEENIEKKKKKKIEDRNSYAMYYARL